MLILKNLMVFLILSLGCFVALGHEDPYMEGQQHLGVEYPHDDIDREEPEVSDEIVDEGDEDQWEYLGEWDEIEPENVDDYEDEYAE